MNVLQNLILECCFILFVWLCLCSLQSSPYSCGARGVGDRLPTDPAPAVGSQSRWYLQQPPPGETIALIKTLKIDACLISVHYAHMHVYTAAVIRAKSKPIHRLFFFFFFFSSVLQKMWKRSEHHRYNMMQLPLVPLQPQHVNHIPLPLPSNNSNKEKNERGSALVSELPCTVFSHILRVLEANGYAGEFTPPSFSNWSCHKPNTHAPAGKDHACFPVFCFIFKTSFGHLGTRMAFLGSNCGIDHTGEAWTLHSYLMVAKDNSSIFRPYFSIFCGLNCSRLITHRFQKFFSLLIFLEPKRWEHCTQLWKHWNYPLTQTIWTCWNVDISCKHISFKLNCCI